MPIRPEDFDAIVPPRPKQPVVITPPAPDGKDWLSRVRMFFSSVFWEGEKLKPWFIPVAIAIAFTILILFLIVLSISSARQDGDQQNEQTSHAMIPEKANDPDQEKLAQSLEQQQAKLDLEKRQLKDAQKALEAQKQQEAEGEARARESAKQEELAREQKQRELDQAQAEARAVKIARQEELARQQERSALEKQAEKEKSPISPVQPSYQGPTSGSLVWEGNINGADLIEIQDGVANQGIVIGTLPGVPCLVQASDPKHITISAPPAPSNNWKGIVLRIQAKGHTTATVRWVLSQ